MSTNPSTPRGESPAAPAFQQRLGLFDATMLVMGVMIGSGIFVVSAYIVRDVGCSGWMLAVWIATGVMTVIGALCYAELAGMMPHAGGQYVFLREAFSPLPGFLYGWVCFLVIQTGSIAAVAVVFAKYLGVFVPSLGTDANIYTSKRGFELKLPLPWRKDDPLVLLDKDHFTISNGQLVAVGVIIFLTYLNCRGVREGKWVQNVLTMAKVLALAALIVLGLTVAANTGAIQANLKEPFAGIEQTKTYSRVLTELPKLPPWILILMVAGSAMTYSLFAADAWNNITFSAGEVQNPRKTLAQSLALGTTLVIVLYLLANLAYLAALPAHGDPGLAKELKDASENAKTIEEKDAVAKRYFEATQRLGIDYADDNRVGTAVLQQATPLGAYFMAIAIMISTFGCVNGMTLMGARLYYAMARDNLFFSSVGRLNSRGVPAVGLILQGIWSIVLVFSGSYDEIVDFVMFVVVAFYALTVAGQFILRWRQPNAERPYKTFGYPVLPALYVFACVGICVVLLFVKPENTWPGLIITVAGIPVYFFWRLRSRASV